MYSILFTVCEVAFDNFFIKEFYDDDEDDGDDVCEILTGLYLIQRVCLRRVFFQVFVIIQ